MYTIGKLAKKFGLSRSTLLYYDSIGLLKPSARSESGYRYYAQEDVKRLERICKFREFGLPLADIAPILESPDTSFKDALEKRFNELTGQIIKLKQQQDLIVGILRRSNELGESHLLGRKTWNTLLHAAGFSDTDMNRWHIEFERSSPESHMRFLLFLGFSKEQANRMRAWCRDNFDTTDGNLRYDQSATDAVVQGTV